MIFISNRNLDNGIGTKLYSYGFNYNVFGIIRQFIKQKQIKKSYFSNYCMCISGKIKLDPALHIFYI